MAPIFVILFLVIYNILKKTVFFQSRSLIISLCVASLCVVGMHQVFVPDETVDSSSGFEVILLLYAALGLSIILMLFFKSFCSRSKNRDNYKRKANHEKRKYLKTKSEKIQKRSMDKDMNR